MSEPVMFTVGMQEPFGPTLEVIRTAFVTAPATAVLCHLGSPA